MSKSTLIISATGHYSQVSFNLYGKWGNNKQDMGYVEHHEMLKNGDLKFTVAPGAYMMLAQTSSIFQRLLSEPIFFHTRANEEFILNIKQNLFGVNIYHDDSILTGYRRAVISSGGAWILGLFKLGYQRNNEGVRL